LEKWQSDSLKKIQRKKKKGVEVADGEDVDEVRTSVLQDQVTGTLFSEEWFPAYQKG
jgi:hypothetical protein